MANNNLFTAKQLKKFVVVEFIEEKKQGVCAMEIICSSWLINNNITYWPSNLQSSSRIMKAAQDNATPNRSWKQLNIRILYETGIGCLINYFFFGGGGSLTHKVVSEFGVSTSSV